MPERDWTEAVTEAWDSLADAYDAVAGTDADYYRTKVIGPGLLKAVGKVDGLNVLDIGCGQGYFSRLLAEAGAHVVGVDISQRQIAHARRREAERPLGIQYVALDATRIGERWPPMTFELAVSSIAFQDMPDPLNVMHGTKRVLTESGRRYCWSNIRSMPLRIESGSEMRMAGKLPCGSIGTSIPAHGRSHGPYITKARPELFSSPPGAARWRNGVPPSPGPASSLPVSTSRARRKSRSPRCRIWTTARESPIFSSLISYHASRCQRGARLAKRRALRAFNALIWNACPASCSIKWKTAHSGVTS